jgi:hypothetical protein
MAMRSFPPPAPKALPVLAAPCLARIVSVAPGGVSVEIPGAAGPVTARVTSTLGARQLAHACAENHSAVVVFEGGNSGRPIIVGLVEPAGDERVEVEPSGLVAKGGEALEATLDGKRVVLDAEDEIVLQCGQASITLRRNGRVVIRGTYVETYATGTNRLKGGQVLIN